MGSLSYAKQERIGIDVSVFKEADSNGLYEDTYFIKNAAIQTHTASTYDYYTYSIYANNGDFGGFKASSAVCYAWFVWQKGYTGDAVVKWIN